MIRKCPARLRERRKRMNAPIRPRDCSEKAPSMLRESPENARRMLRRYSENMPMEAIANAILMRIHTEPRREANQHRRSTTTSKATAKHTSGTDGTHKYFQLPWGIRPPETERSESLESHTMCPRHAHVSRDCKAHKSHSGRHDSVVLTTATEVCTAQSNPAKCWCEP